jgi:hypothetical protein
MPYIPKSERNKAFEHVLPHAGVLNYALHQLINIYFEQNNRNYQTINDVIGVLECAKLELYRRMGSEYEDIKILQNGDCRPYSTWLKDKHKFK